MTSEANRHAPDALKPVDTCSTEAPSTISDFKDFSRLWQLAFNASEDMISVLDMRHRIIAVNQAMANAMGCTPEEAEGQHCYELLHKTNREPKACPHKALLEDGQAHRSEIYEEHLDAWFQVNVTPLYNADNRLVGSIHIARDITKQKRSDRARRESEERYRHLSEATMEGVLLSEDSTIIAANQVLADMMGYTVEKMIGMSMFKFVAPDHRDRLIQTLRSQRDGAHSFDCIREDGTLFSIQAHTRAITYKGAKVYQTAIRDVTEQIRIEKERVQHERMRGVLEMAGAVCHEINQPLMALQGFMEILESHLQSNADVPNHLGRMDDQIERIKKLTHKMMHITKYETKNYPGGEKIIDIEQSAPEDDR